MCGSLHGFCHFYLRKVCVCERERDDSSHVVCSLVRSLPLLLLLLFLVHATLSSRCNTLTHHLHNSHPLSCHSVALQCIAPPLLPSSPSNSFAGDLGDPDENVEHLCWGTGGSPIQGDEKIGLVVGDGADKASLPAQSVARQNNDDQEPLALLVVHAAMHMLFLPQFTTDYYEEEQVRNVRKPAPTKMDKDLRAEAGLTGIKQVENGVVILPKPASIIWSPGAGVTAEQIGFDAGTRKYDKNRIEVLRLLLACCCDPLFSPAEEYNPLASRWLAVAVAADSPNSVCLFYSLLNTLLTYDPNGMPGAFSSDNHAKLVELSAQVLCVLLDCGLPGSPESVVNNENEPVVEFDEASKGGFNVFRTLVARIDTAKEMTFIFNGFANLLKNVYENKHSYLPTSAPKLECFQELLVLLWKFLEENPMFMNHILTTCDVNEIIVPICFLMYQSRRDPAQIGLVHICTFVLLKLSGERSFGVSLNKSFTTKLPCDLPLFSGGHADLVTITLHKLVVNGAYKLVPLYSCFLTIICNISPYWRKMSLVAAVKLVNLFELFSSPKFLYSGEHAHRHLALLLEVFNNIVQYQFTGNHHLVYAVIRRKDSFGRLASLTLQKAQAQCHKVYGDHSTVQYDADKAPMDMVDADGNALQTPMDDDKSSVAGAPFTPTEEWLEDMKATLPLETVTRLLQHLVPIVDEIVARKMGVVDEMEILEVLKDVTMVGLLPVPHAIVIRKYQPNQYTALWFTAFMWGVIFLRNQNLPMFDGQAIELFQVSVQEDEE